MREIEDVKPPVPHIASSNAANTDIIELEARIAAHKIRVKLLEEQVQSPSTIKKQALYSLKR